MGFRPNGIRKFCIRWQDQGVELLQMRELRTQEGRKFENFFSFVRAAADKIGCIFFVDCGEGRELLTEDLEGEDLSGWLIPKDEADKFQKEFDSGEISEKWNNEFVFAIWNQNGKNISIDFKRF